MARSRKGRDVDEWLPRGKLISSRREMRWGKTCKEGRAEKFQTMLEKRGQVGDTPAEVYRCFSISLFMQLSV